MKRIVSLLLACLLLVGCVFSFASCGELSGVYNDAKGNAWKFTAFGLEIYTKLNKEEVIAIYDYSVTEKEDGSKAVTLVEQKMKYKGDNADIEQRIKEMNAAIKTMDEKSRSKEYTLTEGEGYIMLGTTKLTKSGS